MRFSKYILFFSLLGFVFFVSSCLNSASNKLIDEFDIQISEVKVKEFDIKNILFELIFSLDSKSKVEFEVKELNVEIYKTNKYEELLGTSKIKDSFIVYPETKNEFKSDVFISTLKMGISLFSNTLNKKYSFFILVNSKVEYNNITIPITMKKRMDYNPVNLEIELK